MLERLGLSVHKKEGMEEKLSDNLPKEEGKVIAAKKKGGKGKRELWNLKWEVRDKEY